MENNKLVSKSFDDIANNLSLHVSNKFLFRQDQIRAYSGATFDKTDWSSKNMRRIHFSDCNFFDVNFKSSGFTGSIFRNCDFDKGILDYTIFDECLFINCNFYDNSIKAASFCKAEFISCTMDNIKMDACFFTDAVFNTFEFNNCIISDIIWENAKFLKCDFNDTILQKLNFEFTYFVEIHFKNTAIPFGSIPFVFGGISYIRETQDQVYIKTLHPSYENNRMSQRQYVEFLPDLLVFYKETTNYFPLANIYLGLGDFEKGIEAIKKGLKFWFSLHNYKLMYYLCELANTYEFSIDKRQEIYDIIEKCNRYILVDESWTQQKRWNDQQYKMRECLLNSQSIPCITFEFLTCIEPSDYKLLGEFMNTIEKYFIPSNSYYSLELRHNSPFDLLYTLFADEQTLFNTVVGIISILGVCEQFYSNHLKDKIKKAKSNTNISQEDKKHIEEKVTKNIINVHYNFYNCNISNLDTNYLTRQNIGCEKPESSGSSQ